MRTAPAFSRFRRSSDAHFPQFTRQRVAALERREMNVVSLIAMIYGLSTAGNA